MNIRVLLADGFEETEAITLIDLLRRAGYQVQTVSINNSLEVKGAHAITIIADLLLDNENFSDIDMLVLPGGVPGVPNLAKNEKVISTIKSLYSKNKYIAAICAAPYLLEIADVIKGKMVTLYPGWRDKITSAKLSDEKVVVFDKIITSQGVGTAIDMGLKIIEILSGKDASLKMKEAIVYN